ncbi:MAG TPA: glycosyl hydrolase 115 family protein [Bacteroidota bacterium]|nr:glycosyl hydrolase 115 family protein [Bacteroidota bacterium]
MDKIVHLYKKTVPVLRLPLKLFALSILLNGLTLRFAVAQTIVITKSESYVSQQHHRGDFALSSAAGVAPIVVSSHDYPGVILVAQDLAEDVERVTGKKPIVLNDTPSGFKEMIIAGTIGKSSLIDTLVAQKKLDVAGVSGKWEAFITQVIDDPIPGVDRALVIAGSDKRGTMYGMFDLSEKIGVSPWYWWADVPVQHREDLFVRPGRYTLGQPAVKYRGIFINDEAPALSGWTKEKFGGFNSKFYVHVFELILRMKGNYLWPAMWGSAFNDDDPMNEKLADEYGIVMGTSHHEPMMRAQQEWERYGKGPWNYETNDSVLRDFWRGGIKRMDSYESIVTIGMRGNGDMPMTQGSNIALLERIVNDQREIIGQVTGKDVTTIPQDWALYKEVQDYYDKGMRVPDDVTLLLCDDNWGNIRRLPKLTDPPRTGGYGIYYHYDYVGGPRNYKWLNTNQIERAWEQMHLAYAYGAKQIWIVNVGDIKPMEFPIEFFLDYAWNPGQWPAARLPEYTQQWAEEQFGKEHAVEIAEILHSYTQFNARRKPELLSPATYSLTDYREAETVVAEYDSLAAKAQHLYDILPKEYRDAFYQLVLHPVLACSNLNDLYVTVAKNRIDAQEGRAATNALALKARELFERDSAISYFYNHTMSSGKWDHMMDQTHIGYTYWQQPDRNVMPDVKIIDLPVAPDMGVEVEGQTGWWPNETGEAALPEFDPFNRQSYYVELFNRGKTPFDYSIEVKDPWVRIENSTGRIESEKRVWVNIAWTAAPKGIQRSAFTITGPTGQQVVVHVAINNPASPKPNEVDGFVEGNGYVSIEAEHYTKKVDASPIGWETIPGLGRTLSAVMPTPVTAGSQTPGGNSPHLEYKVYLFSKGNLNVDAYVSPTLNFHNDQGLRYAISFDDAAPQIVTINADNSNRTWERWVANNINITSSSHTIETPGVHVLKFWMVDPGVVLQKLVIDAGGVKPSYLGPPESFHRLADGKKGN